MELTHSSRYSVRKGLSYSTKRTSGNFFGRCWSHPQVHLAALQAVSIVIGAIVTLYLAGLGLDAAELLIYTKVETFFITIPMHILTLHEAKGR